MEAADGEAILRALERVAESFERDMPAYVDQWWFHPLERRVGHLADDLGAPFLEGDQEQRIAGSNCWGRCSEGSLFGLDGPAGLTAAGKQLWVANSVSSTLSEPPPG
jgi:hypothetical protein